MLKRYLGKWNTSKACHYRNMMYFSGVSAPHETTLYNQAKAALMDYDSMFHELGLKKDHIVNAFIMLDESNFSGFFEAWDEWILPGELPAMTAIHGKLEGNTKVSICLWVAEKDDIVRTKLPDEGGMLVRYDGVAYFSGQCVYDNLDTLTDQTRAIYDRYERYLKDNDLRLENILNGNIYCQDITMQDEYESQWIAWTHTGHKPAGTMVEGHPLKKEHLLELGLTFVDSPEVENVKRVKPGENCCRYVEYNKVAYFTGHVCADAAAKDLYDHTKGVLNRFKIAFDEYGLSMDNIITASAYISDIDEAPLFRKAWDEWVKPGCEPARNIIQTRMLDDKFRIELAIIVADE